MSQNNTNSGLMDYKSAIEFLNKHTFNHNDFAIIQQDTFSQVLKVLITTIQDQEIQIDELKAKKKKQK